MLRVDYEQLEELFRHHASYLLDQIAGYAPSNCQHICFDGKTIRRIDLSCQNQSLLQFLNGYMIEIGLIIYHALPKKTFIAALGSGNDINGRVKR